MQLESGLRYPSSRPVEDNNMSGVPPYAIGTPGQPWGAAERADWLTYQQVQRSYANEVLAKIDALRETLDVEQYGRLDYASGPYALMIMRTRDWQVGRPCALITGGVHGYETSGVQGAIRFAATEAQRLSQVFNIVVAPCVSPWGYETINRWNPDTIDPNRSFVADSPAEECAALMRWLDSHGVSPEVHIDLHETTNTDNSEFRPARSARDGRAQSVWSIPDGFYLVGRTDRPVPAFQAAVRASVARVTHIAPATDGQLIGVPIEQVGVINYDAVALGLCMGLTGATYTTTTEVYPDSPQVDDEACIVAQVAAVVGGLEFVAGG
jgi:hypothetical protein